MTKRIRGLGRLAAKALGTRADEVDAPRGRPGAVVPRVAKACAPDRRGRCASCGVRRA